MKFPYAITGVLPLHLQSRWKCQFEACDSRDRTIEEGIWRRTQTQSNSTESGWSSPDDCRRRIIHYHYKFGLNHEKCLAVQSLYIYSCLTLPKQELDIFDARVTDSLRDGAWQPKENSTWEKEDLICHVKRYDHHPEDVTSQRTLPSNYKTSEVIVRSKRCSMTVSRELLPWEVLARGIRKKDERGTPTIVKNLALLKHYIPFQVELGCGISLEAKIPPLHCLHDFYTVTNRSNNKFIFGGRDDTFLTNFLEDPALSMHERSSMMRACLEAEPTQAHKVIKNLVDLGIILTPIITNNFDGLPLRVGLQEYYIRRYDEDVPEVTIYKDTKALLVIGSHADRRRIQSRFRAQKLPIFFLDPEGFWENSDFREYLIEGAKNSDFVCHKGAEKGLLELSELLGIHVNC